MSSIYGIQSTMKEDDENSMQAIMRRKVPQAGYLQTNLFMLLFYSGDFPCSYFWYLDPKNSI